jgi:hypothetical protein
LIKWFVYKFFQRYNPAISRYKLTFFSKSSVKYSQKSAM